MKTKDQKRGAMAKLSILCCWFIMLSCSNDDEAMDSASLIERYGPMGTYTLSVSPTIGATALASGTINGTLTKSEKGVLRLVFFNFQVDPMPFVMDVDVQFTLSESDNEILVHNVDGKGFFDANPPEDADEMDIDEIPGLVELPEGALEEGLHSNGKSVVSGYYGLDSESFMQFDLELDPAVGLPVIIKISTLEKL